MSLISQAFPELAIILPSEISDPVWLYSSYIKYLHVLES